MIVYLVKYSLVNEIQWQQQKANKNTIIKSLYYNTFLVQKHSLWEEYNNRLSLFI